MNGQILALRRPVVKGPQDEVIEVLEEALRQVRAGAINTVLVVTCLVKDEHCGAAEYRIRGGPLDSGDVLWLLEMVKQDLLYPERG